jgi:hypothetical protein
VAVAYATSSSVAEATAVNATYTAPTGIVDGDLLIICHFLFSATTPVTPTAPSGFATVPGVTWPLAVAPTGANGHVWLWYKFASSESGNYVVTHASSVRRGIMARVTGADSSSPFTPAPTQNTATNSSTYTFLGVTTSVDSELIMLFGSDWNDTANNLTPPTGTTPTFTEQVDIAGEYLATGNLSPAGATGNKTMANNSAAATTSGWLAVTVAVQPTSASSTPAVPQTFNAIPFMKGGGP